MKKFLFLENLDILFYLLPPYIQLSIWFIFHPHLFPHLYNLWFVNIDNSFSNDFWIHTLFDTIWCMWQQSIICKQTLAPPLLHVSPSKPFSKQSLKGQLIFHTHVPLFKPYCELQWYSFFFFLLKFKYIPTFKVALVSSYPFQPYLMPFLTYSSQCWKLEKGINSRFLSKVKSREPLSLL